MKSKQLFITFVVIAFTVGQLNAQNLGGFTGLFNIPSAHMQKDKTMMLGAHLLDKNYGSYRPFKNSPPNEFDALVTYANVTFLPFMEFQFRYTFLQGIDRTAFFGDRMLSARFRIIDGRDKKLPTITIGLEDFGSPAGAHFYNSNYLVASQKFIVRNLLSLDATLGYGMDIYHPFIGRTRDRLQHDGLFGGIAVGINNDNESALMLEYDSRRWNVASRIQLFRSLQVLVGLYDFKALSGGVSYKFVL